MAHFAKIEDGIVTQVIVVGDGCCLDANGVESEEAGQAFIASVGLGGEWKQTSYNMRGGVHRGGKEPFRKNYAGRGDSYREDLDAFVPPKRHDSWNLDPESCHWVAPVPMPQDGKLYGWDEENLDWKELE